MLKNELNDLEKISVEITDNMLNKQHELEHIEEMIESSIPHLSSKRFETDLPVISKPKSVSIQHVDNMSKSKSNALKNSEITKESSKTKELMVGEKTTDTFSIAGLNFPKCTLFLIIAVIVIAIALFYKGL